MAPRIPEQPGDGGFTNPRVFDSVEDAIAAGTSEDQYLDSLDQPTNGDLTGDEWSDRDDEDLGDNR